jgi:hypothetical protein
MTRYATIVNGQPAWFFGEPPEPVEPEPVAPPPEGYEAPPIVPPATYYEVVEVPKPADVPGKVWEQTLQLDDGVPAMVWVQRDAPVRRGQDQAEQIIAAIQEFRQFVNSSQTAATNAAHLKQLTRVMIQLLKTQLPANQVPPEPEG